MCVNPHARLEADGRQLLPAIGQDVNRAFKLRAVSSMPTAALSKAVALAPSELDGVVEKGLWRRGGEPAWRMNRQSALDRLLPENLSAVALIPNVGEWPTRRDRKRNSGATLMGRRSQSGRLVSKQPQTSSQHLLQVSASRATFSIHYLVSYPMRFEAGRWRRLKSTSVVVVSCILLEGCLPRRWTPAKRSLGKASDIDDIGLSRAAQNIECT